MRVRKQNKVHFAKGSAWSFDKNGERVSIDSLNEALEHESKCCGLNCCENTITLGVNDSNGTDEYPAKFEFIKSGASYFLRLTITTDSGVTVKEVELT